MMNFREFLTEDNIDKITYSNEEYPSDGIKFTPKGCGTSTYIGRLTYNYVFFEVFALSNEEKAYFKNPDKVYIIGLPRTKERSLVKINEIKGTVCFLDKNKMHDQDKILYFEKPLKKFYLTINNGRLFKMNQV